jgi:hypothetical protein
MERNDKQVGFSILRSIFDHSMIPSRGMGMQLFYKVGVRVVFIGCSTSSGVRDRIEYPVRNVPGVERARKGKEKVGRERRERRKQVEEDGMERRGGI